MNLARLLKYSILSTLLCSCVQSEIVVDIAEDKSITQNKSDVPVRSKLNIQGTVNVNENIASGFAQVQVSLDRPTSMNASFDYSITPVSSETSDQSLIGGTINFNLGDQIKYINIPITDDSIDEFDESFKVILSNSTNVDLQTTESNITILDDDPDPVISIADYTAQPGERAKISITLDRESEKGLSFQIDSSQSGVAIDSTDYQNISGQVINYPDNTTSLIFEAKTYFLNINEPTKDFSLIISNPNFSTIGDGISLVDITVPGGGNFDKAFSDDGREISITNGPYDRAKAIIPLSNGYAYTLNHSQANGSIHRYTDEGELDPTFSSDGILTTNWFSGYDQFVDGAAYLDNSLIVINSSRNTTDSFDIAKINPDGSFDTSFNGDGTKEISVSGKAIAMDIDRSGKILVGGYKVNADNDIYLTRVNIDGSLDTSFGSAGVVELDLLGTNTNDYIHDVKANSDGTIYISGVNLTGTSGPTFVARLLEDGSLDTSFSTDGIYESIMQVDYSSRSMKSSINVLANREVILTTPNREATRTYDCQLEKIQANGIVDTSFGVSGYFTSAVGPNIRACRKTLEDKNGNLVVYAELASGGFPDAVFVLSSSGVLDNSFNGGVGYRTGMTGTAQGVQFYRGFSMSSDGKLLFAGGFNDIGVAKVWYTDDNTPNITITDESFNEGASGHYLIYQLSHRVEFPFQIQATTADISANSGSDYIALSSSSIENLGRVGGKINISVNDDGVTEGDETLNVNISSTHPDVNITDSQGVLTIKNDD